MFGCDCSGVGACGGCSCCGGVCVCGGGVGGGGSLKSIRLFLKKLWVFSFFLGSGGNVKKKIGNWERCGGLEGVRYLLQQLPQTNY